MRILLDTNVLCRLVERGHPDHAIADNAVSTLRGNHHELCLVPQVLYEYWAVVTRPVADNGLGMSAADADRAVDLWIKAFVLLRDERGVFEAWREVVRMHDVQGKSAHDARLVAAMQRHQLVHLLTFNMADFRRYPGIEILDVRSVTDSAS